MSIARRVRGVALVASLVGSAACGGGSGAAFKDGSPADVGRPNDTMATEDGGTPVQLCQELVTTLCSRFSSCTGADGSADAESHCRMLENIDFGCDRATSAGFPPCLSDVKNLSCASLFTANGLSTPSSCNEPLSSIPLSDAQMKCLALVGVVCQKGAACSGISIPTATDLMQCEQDVATQIQCGYAVGVSSTYQQCLTDFPNAPCGSSDGGATDGGSVDGGTMPLVPSCMGVIQGA
jgi:hypothetical protein